jgi:predicted nucleic-acid-binding protein
VIGLDTNVLVRVLVDDGSADVTKARKFVAAQAAEGCDFFVDTVVLVEMVWVLETVFGYGRTDIGTAIDAILGNAAYVVDGRETVAAALALFRNGKADFSDCLIVARNAAAGCTGTASLDKAMRPLSGVIAL